MESESWTLGKTYVNKEQGTSTLTFSKNRGPNDGAAWHGRLSEHAKEVGGWDYFWSGLGVNHSEHETERVLNISLTCHITDPQ